MATIPTLEGSQIVPAQYAGAPIDPNAAIAPARGKMAVAAGLRNAAGVGLELADRMQSAEEAGKLADAERQMRDAWAGFQTDMQEMPDEEVWRPEWEKRSRQVRELVDKSSEGMRAPARAQLEERLASWNSDTAHAVDHGATKQTISRNKAKLVNLAEQVWKAGDYERGAVFIDTAEKAGLLFPEDAQALRAKGAELVDFSKANAAITANPIAAQEALEDKTPSGRYRNFEHLDANTRQALIVESRRAASAKRSETYQALVERQMAGEILKPDEMQRLVDQKLLTSTQAKAMLREQARSGGDPAVMSSAAKAFTAADGYVKADDPTNERYVEILSMGAGLPSNLRDELERRLKRQETPDTEAALMREANDYIERAYRAGFYGNTSIFDGEALDPVQYEEASRWLVHLKTELRKFVDSKVPPPTPMEQLAYIQELDKDRITTIGTLLNGISGRASK